MNVKKLVASIVILIIAVFGSTLLLSPDKQENKGYTPEFFEELKAHSLYVSRVIDGDTIEVKDGDAIIKFRLVGIDTPETVHPEKEVECFGEEAKAELKGLIENKEIYFNYDNAAGLSDQYGRTLVYVWRKEDDLFINSHMLEEGYAHFYENKSPIFFDEDFRELETLAREQGRGLWGDACK